MSIGENYRGRLLNTVIHCPVLFLPFRLISPILKAYSVERGKKGTTYMKSVCICVPHFLSSANSAKTERALLHGESFQIVTGPQHHAHRDLT